MFGVAFDVRDGGTSWLEAALPCRQYCLDDVEWAIHSQLLANTLAAGLIGRCVWNAWTSKWSWTLHLL